MDRQRGKMFSFALCALQNWQQKMCPTLQTASTFDMNTRLIIARCTNARHYYSRATFRTREGPTYEAAWGRRPSETKCSDLCHKSAGSPRWNSWKLPVSSPWTASSPRKESLERSARRPARPRASGAPGWTLRVEMHSDRWSSWKLKTRRWTGGCCAAVCILSPWSCLWAAPPLPRAPSPLFDGAVFRLRTATPAQDSSFDRGGGAMHLRVAREVEWSLFRVTPSGRSVSGLLGVLYARDRRDYKSAAPVPAPPRAHQSGRHPEHVTPPSAFLIGSDFFFLQGEIKRPLKRERS